ncbi:NAD-dependent epimerase/dehydratase family protein [Candidatus Pelagibacter bacterium nBUS_44]|uniref:NAD-dependent epimerase/dehydratase family protein n=1 Tax=Candidatus Pelagibacter bacterium nBUS_44 TaxID=3374195 RepID=UPI003EBE598A
MLNKKILILGATGQIGKELSLEFKSSKDLDVLSHSRTLVGSSFFKNNDINFVAAELNDNKVISKISNTDLIFDLAAPDHGSLKDIKEFYKKRFDFIFSHMKKDAKFVFASSMNAFGIDNKRKVLKKYFISSSIYASNKRFAEKYIKNLGKKKSIQIYILRLAEVHGHYQRASTEIINLIKDKYLFKIPKTPAWITFVTLIKQSIINILDDKEAPGLYTLTCDDIYWHDLLNILGAKINLKPKFIINKNEKKNIILNFLYKIILSKKDLLRGNFNFNEDFENSIKLAFRIRKTKNSIEKFKGIKIYSDKDRYTGILPGKRLRSLIYDTKKILD